MCIEGQGVCIEGQRVYMEGKECVWRVKSVYGG